jgi:ORF6N domain
MQIEQAIFLIRGQRVMLDRDLAAMYDVTTGNINKAVRRNLSRFPADFMFQLTVEEADSLRFQFGILDKGLHFKYLPNIFSGISVHVRPHPGPRTEIPIPNRDRGEGERHHVAGQFLDLRCRHRFCVICRETHDNSAYRMAQNAANDSPSPGGEGRGEGGRLP